MDPIEAAGTEAARRKVKRAAGLLRDAGRELAVLTDGPTVLAASCVHDDATAAHVADVIADAIRRHGAVDVVVTARPQARAPTTAP